MSATKILWGQIIIVFLVVLITTWAATQYVAWQLGFQAQLGAPWFRLVGMPVYQPPAFFGWWFSYDAYAPEVFNEGAYIAASGGVIVDRGRHRHVGMAGAGSKERRDLRLGALGRERGRCGRLGCSCPDGVVLGKLGRDYLRHDGPEHVLCFAPTRSGKGVGLVVPTLLTWPGSAIVHDIKGENWLLTAGFRAQLRPRPVVRSDQSEVAAYNPLLEVRRGDWEIRDVQNVADVLVDPEGALDKRNHWEKTSHCSAGRRHPACPLRRGGQDARRRRQLPLRSEAADRVDAAGDDDDAASRRRRRRIPSLRRTARELLNKIRQRAFGRAVDRDVVPRPLSRSRRRPGDAALRLAHRRPDRGAEAGDALPGGAALRHQPHQAADPAGPEPDRAPPDRGTAYEGPASIACC